MLHTRYVTFVVSFARSAFMHFAATQRHWGTKALPTISILLQRELPGLRGFSESGLKRMRTFYEEWKQFLIRPTVLGELDIDEHLFLQLIGQPVNTEFTWDDFVKISFSHHIEILTRSKDVAEITI